MKKAIIFLALFTCFSFVSFTPKSDTEYIKPKTTTNTKLIIEPYNPTGMIVNCYRNSDPYWPSNTVCCCTIRCDFSTGGSTEFRCCVDYTSNNFVSNPPSTTPTFCEIDAGCSLEDTQTYTSAQITDFNSFKASGNFNISNDILNTDENGNVTLIRSGNYKVINNKLQVLVSQVNL